MMQRKDIVLALAAFALIYGKPGAAFGENAAAPKRVIVVLTSTRNRFETSIEAAEKKLEEMAEKSHAFTLTFVRQPAVPQPRRPKPPAALELGASPERQAAFIRAEADYETAAAVYTEAESQFDDELKQELQILSPESLKNYDGVIFCYTSGDLPLPDFNGFLAWIKAGHAFIGIGNAMETMVSYPSYYDMLGGKWAHFKGPQEWTTIDVLTENPSHPANKGIPAKWPIREFNYKVPDWALSDPANTEELLALDKSPTDQTPGHFPLAWGRQYGRGRVFYTSLGENLDLWNSEQMGRKNSPETARIFQLHFLHGIEWALNLNPTDL
jgi:type 1 glutamine amidotransferase